VSGDKTIFKLHHATHSSHAAHTTHASRHASATGWCILFDLSDDGLGRNQEGGDASRVSQGGQNNLKINEYFERGVFKRSRKNLISIFKVCFRVSIFFIEL
jgi:hypothetical protein